MNVLYMILLGVAIIVLVLDAISERKTVNGHHRVGVKLLPLALIFWVLVPFIQFAKLVF